MDKRIEDKYFDLINQARIAGSKDNWEECIKYYQEAFKNMVIAEDLLDMALAHLQIGQLYNCKNTIDKVLNILPNSSKAHFFLAIYYEEINDVNNALFEYQNVIEAKKSLVEEQTESYFAIGRIYDDQGDFTKAEQMYQEALSRNSKHFFANLNLGSLYEKNDMLDLALDYTKKAYAVSANEAMVNYNLAVVYMRKGNFEEAIKYYQKEIALKDGYIMAYFNLGIIYKDIYKDYEKAKLYYLEGLEKDKTNYSVWYNLGCLYAILKDYSNCYNCLLYAVMLNKENLNLIIKDEELEEFRKTDYYNLLLNQK